MGSIVFVSPPLTIQDRYGLKFQSGGQTPPTGLANLAAMVRRCGRDTAIVDAAALGWGYERTVQAVLEGGHRYVGITAVTISISHAGRLARMLKEANRDLVIIAGGPHFSAVPGETLARYPDFDLGVMGEGDHTIVELLEALDQGRNLEEVPGLALCRDGGVHLTGRRKPIMKLDELPLPAWDLLPDLAHAYCPPVHTVKRVPAGMLVTSRGCPGKCVFCANNVFGSTCRAYSAEYALTMIKELHHRYGLREIQIRDDNFLVYRKRLIELCHMLKAEGMDLVWSCTGRVDNVTPDILRLMKEAGCWQIWYGIESGSQMVLDLLKKDITLPQAEAAVRMTAEAGIDPCGFFILGNPGETPGTLEETIEFALRLPLAEAHFGFMTPLPGAELYERAEEFGLFANNWDSLTGWTPSFIPFGLTEDQLRRASKKAFRSFYFRPRIIWAYLKKMRSFRHVRVYLNGLLALGEFLLKRKGNPAFRSSPEKAQP